MPEERAQAAGAAPADSHRCFCVGSARYPQVRWTEERLVVAWSEYASARECADEALVDEFLKLACLVRAPGAIEALEAEYMRPLGQLLFKRTGDAELTDEVLQLVRQKLLVGESPRLASYRSTGHFRAWLRVVAFRTCQDLTRQRGARWAHQAPLGEELVDVAKDPAAQLMKGQLDVLFVSALRDAIRGLPERERYVLRMHVLAGWNVDQVGAALGAHRATAARWIVTAKQRLNQSLRASLRDRLELSPCELERLFSMLNTQLDLRLTEIFNTTPALGAAPAAGAGEAGDGPEMAARPRA